MLPGLRPRVRPMASHAHGYWGLELEGVEAGARYGYRLDRGPLRPDPASRSQPGGVDGLSEIIDPGQFRWTDGRWAGRPLEELVFYELHVGTFSPSGSLEGIVPWLRYLSRLGVTAVELMPVAPFSGRRNWGYDGVYPFAVHRAYGGLPGLQHLSNACHAHGLALFVDVVYNHVGPEGSYLREFGPYFTQSYRTPWGEAINFDGPGSDHVRRFFRESATSLVEAAHLDGLRVDAVHAIVDPTAQPFLGELTQHVGEVRRRTGRRIWLIAESALNDPRVVAPVREGGWGFDATWNDDFHHALHRALTGESDGYFADFSGVADLARALVEGFVLSGRFSTYRGRRHGRPASRMAASQFVVFAQNHDQVGNRPFGERLACLVPFEAQKLAAGITLLSPYLPLLFMGEEYGERAPFLYFTSHRGRRLARAVREGRRAAFVTPAGGRGPPNPQDPATFRRSRLDLRRRFRTPHRELLRLHSALLALRRAWITPRRLASSEVGLSAEDPTVLWVRRPGHGRARSLAVYRIGPGTGGVALPRVGADLTLRLNSADERFGGAGSSAPRRLGSSGPRTVELRPWSFLFYTEP